MLPKVSVVIPVYNAAEYLGQCLTSVLLQSLQNIEVICVNDGSTDSSLNVLNSYAMFDKRLKIITQENAGGAAARNRGLKEATGEFIIFLDSDDFFDPEMLEKMVSVAEKDKSDVVVCGWFQYSNEKQAVTQEVKVIPDDYIQKSPFKRSDLAEFLFIFAANAPWNKLIRSSFLKKQGILFDENSHSADDVYFSGCLIGTAETISVTPYPFVFYRTNPTGLTSTTSGKDSLMPDLCQTLSKTYLYLKNYDLPYDLLAIFGVRVQKSLCWVLQSFPKEKICQNLLSIKEHLHPDLYHFLFDNSSPKVSIVVPVYNAAEFLSECLDSCIKQTLKEIEIICVDDGSKDDSLKILNEYAKQDNRIKVIHQENQGLPISRNNAMKLATGKYIQFLDSDDYLNLETCECLYLYSRIYELDMLFFAATEFNHETREEFELPYHCLKWLPDNFAPVFSWKTVKEIMFSVAVTACLTFYRYDFLKKNNIQWINKKICYEDSPFFIESIFKTDRVGALPKKFYHRRIHKAAITQNMSSNFLDCCEISRLTLKIAKQYADDVAFSSLFYGYVRKAWKNYLILSQADKIKYIRSLLASYAYLKNEYKLPFSDEIERDLKIIQNSSSVIGKPKVAILYIATGKYISLWEKFYKATEKYFLPDCEKTYFLFTDQKDLKLPQNVVPVYISHEQWPYITLKRYHFFCSQKETLKNFDYLYFMNSNLNFQTAIGNEVLPTQEQGLVATIHPWYLDEKKENFTYDRNPKSKAYIAPEEGEYYFMGGFNGGTSSTFLEMAETIKDWTDEDLKNNVMPLWHDESMLNRYLINYMKQKSPLILFPDYVVPEEMNLKWDGIKGILLDKKKEIGMDYLKTIKKY